MIIARGSLLPFPPPGEAQAVARPSRIARALALALALSSGGASPAPAQWFGRLTTLSEVEGERAEVVRIRRAIDGDTVVTEAGARVRYIGIDAPETRHPRRPPECLGQEAAALNRALVEGERVMLVRDVSDRDRYGRLLRYVYLLDAEGRPARLVNAELVARGLARARFYPPDTGERERILAAQERAIREKRGIWGRPPGGPACPRTARGG